MSRPIECGNANPQLLARQLARWDEQEGEREEDAGGVPIQSGAAEGHLNGADQSAQSRRRLGSRLSMTLLFVRVRYRSCAAAPQPRSPIISAEPDAGSGELDQAEVAAVMLLVPGRDGPEVLEPVEETLDEVPVAVQEGAKGGDVHANRQRRAVTSRTTGPGRPHHTPGLAGPPFFFRKPRAPGGAEGHLAAAKVRSPSPFEP